MRLFISLGLLQVALSVAAVMENIAVGVKSSINETEFKGILGRDVESSHLTKRLVINDENWCDGRIDGATEDYKPYSAVCNWELDRSYKVLCKTEDQFKAVWVQDYCAVGEFCQQLENAAMWNGQLGFDIACKPSAQLVKWPIGSRLKGADYKIFCSDVYIYDLDRTRTAVYEFFESFWGELGQKTQILFANILFNGKVIQQASNTNQLGARHTLAPRDTIKYCGEAGSSALIEGYASAKFISWV
jgi:hypothetical protein